MATPRTGGKFISFAQSVIDRVSGKGAQTQDATPAAAPAASVNSTPATQVFQPESGYFTPGRPLAPIAPPGSTTGRRWDFPSYFNLNYTPRTEQGENAIDFPTLRRMADPAQGGLDPLRLAIETRKDQMSAQKWQIRGRGKDDDGGARARQFETWMRKPDGIHTFQQWMRMLMEDHFVIDAPTLYFSILNGRPLFEPVDGATIKLLITAIDGRTPMPPVPAYQQVIKGTPAQSYTLDELGYYPYNLRSSHVYGFSRVEQIVVTTSIFLNRMMSQLAYFTEGTVPDGFMELPKTWSLDEITRFTDWFNSEMSGALGEKRKIRFVPEGANYVPTKDEILKDAFDEWLIRIICYAFSLSPQAFVKEMNRATSDTAKETALEEGLEPVKIWFKDVMDDLLLRCGFDDLQWQWADEEIVDPEVKSRVIINYAGGETGGGPKIITVAEAREMAGFKPATPAQMLELMPPAPEVDPNANDGNGNGSNGNGSSNGKPNPPKTPPAEKITIATPRTFGYDRMDGIRSRMDAGHDRLTARLDHVAEKVSGIDALQTQVMSMRSAIDRFVTRPVVETPAPNITINAPPAPDVTVHAHIPAPSRNARKLTGRRNEADGSIEFTESREGEDSGQQ